MTWPLTATMAPLLADDINTDVIYPARFLLVLERQGLGDYAFADLRKQEDFVLNDPRYAGANILLAGKAFGSGSSREHAVWTLVDCGYTVIIAESFGDIFYRNCIDNGVLPISTTGDHLQMLAEHAEAGKAVTVDLVSQTISMANKPLAFALPPSDKRRLLSRQTSIDRIEAEASARGRFEANQLCFVSDKPRSAL